MKTNRPTKQYVFMQMAKILSQRATCARRDVGCILVDRHDHIVGSGYNGNAAGLQHCININCAGAQCTSGVGLDICEAIHAEQNALMQCKDVEAIVSCYVTTLPCMHCMKMLLNTGCQNIFYKDVYSNYFKTINLWESAGRNIVRMVEDSNVI